MEATKKIILLSLAMLSVASVKADNWGCEVLLCLSNPAGPMAVKECVPPIKRLYAAIFKWRPDPFPTCAMAYLKSIQLSGDAATLHHETQLFATLKPASLWIQAFFVFDDTNLPMYRMD